MKIVGGLIKDYITIENFFTLKNLGETNNLFDSCRKKGNIWEVDIRPRLCLKRKDVDVNLCINHVYINCDVL